MIPSSPNITYETQEYVIECIKIYIFFIHYNIFYKWFVIIQS